MLVAIVATVVFSLPLLAMLTPGRRSSPLQRYLLATLLLMPVNGGLWLSHLDTSNTGRAIVLGVVALIWMATFAVVAHHDQALHDRLKAPSKPELGRADR